MSRRPYRQNGVVRLKSRNGGFTPEWLRVSYRNRGELKRQIQARALATWRAQHPVVDMTTADQDRGGTITLAGQDEPCAWFTIHLDTPDANGGAALFPGGTP